MRKEENGCRRLETKRILPAEKRLKASGRAWAYTFGMISPKRSRRSVRMTVCVRKPSTGDEEKSKIRVKAYPVRMTIATLTRLLPMRIVASSRSESLRSSRRALSAGCSSSLIASISDGEREKKATSDEDINAERMSRTAETASAIHAAQGITSLMT